MPGFRKWLRLLPRSGAVCLRRSLPVKAGDTIDIVGVEVVAAVAADGPIAAGVSVHIPAVGEPRAFHQLTVPLARIRPSKEEAA